MARLLRIPDGGMIGEDGRQKKKIPILKLSREMKPVGFISWKELAHTILEARGAHV